MRPCGGDVALCGDGGDRVGLGDWVAVDCCHNHEVPRRALRGITKPENRLPFPGGMIGSKFPRRGSDNAGSKHASNHSRLVVISPKTFQTLGCKKCQRSKNQSFIRLGSEVQVACMRAATGCGGGAA